MLLAFASLLLIFLILMDGFESMVQPRRVTRRLRFARFFYRATWRMWRLVACRLKSGKLREGFLSLFGPLSLLLLLAAWVVGLIFGFALLGWSLETRLQGSGELADFSTYLYLSGVTFFTLGYGEVTPISTTGRFLAVAEAGIGFGFLAVIIGYLPVVYQAFSQLEVSILLLDARAGSPPTAGQMLVRMGPPTNDVLDPFLAEWERWSASLLGSHLAFPVLAYYRSQHDNQSWLAALTSILDLCALVVAGVEGVNAAQARLTLAMARHAVVDLALIFKVPPQTTCADRLPAKLLLEMRQQLKKSGVELHDGPAVDQKLEELRRLYEPFVASLARHFLFTLPPVWPTTVKPDNWQTTRWTGPAPGIGAMIEAERHFG